MTRFVKKCVREFLDSDGLSIAAANLNDAAASFSDKQEGCCPQFEVYTMFRRAYREGTLVSEKEDGIVVRYRALTDYEREQADEHDRNNSLHRERALKTRALKPSSRRLNPAPIIQFDPEGLLEQDSELDEDDASYREHELVTMS